ncbi:MAG TPA: NAD(P)H-dependent oxidoreductase [Puia sp.]|nr:NAD(P)H-dependent oxidoreductase [Puia sp.]
MVPSKKKKILAVSGSTRKASSNHSLIMAIAGLATEIFDVTLYEGIADLPHFNPDALDDAGPKVANFKKLLKESDGVLICTPEYAHGVPGSLKNAIDWTVGTSDFFHKPTALITASSDGRYGHKALLEILRVIEAGCVDRLQLLVPFIKTKIGKGDVIIHEDTLLAVRRLIGDLDAAIGDPGVVIGKLRRGDR